MTAFAAPLAADAAQGPEGCLGGGVAPPPEYCLPNLWNGFVVVSDERRDDGQLAATFADPADTLSRLHACCWTGQAERVYVRDGLTIDVSVHGFLGFEGATLAQRWFGHQRAKDLGFKRDAKTRAQLEAVSAPANIEPFDGIAVHGYYDDAEHVLYARRGDVVAWVSVWREPSVSGRSREFVAYQVLALVFGVDLLPTRIRCREERSEHGVIAHWEGAGSCASDSPPLSLLLPRRRISSATTSATSKSLIPRPGGCGFGGVPRRRGGRPSCRTRRSSRPAVTSARPRETAIIARP